MNKAVNPEAIIGEGTIIEYGAVIYGNVTIGKRCYIGPHAVIGEPAEHPGRDYFLNGSVIIEDDVHISNHVLISSPSSDGGETLIQEGAQICSHAYIGHDATIGHKSAINTGAKILGNVTIARFCNIGANAVIHQGISIPEGCMVGANAFISKTFEPKTWGVYHNEQAATYQKKNKLGIERFDKHFANKKEELK